MKKVLCKLFGHSYNKIEFLHGGLLQNLDLNTYTVVIICKRCNCKHIVFHFQITENKDLIIIKL